MNKLLFWVVLFAPHRNLSNQFQWEWFTVGELNGAFAGFVVRQSVGERFHSLRAGVQSDVPLEGRELDQVMPLPVGGHTPGDFFR